MMSRRCRLLQQGLRLRLLLVTLLFVCVKEESTCVVKPAPQRQQHEQPVQQQRQQRGACFPLVYTERMPTGSVYVRPVPLYCDYGIRMISAPCEGGTKALSSCVGVSVLLFSSRTCCNTREPSSTPWCMLHTTATWLARSTSDPTTSSNTSSSIGCPRNSSTLSSSYCGQGAIGRRCRRRRETALTNANERPSGPQCTKNSNQEDSSRRCGYSKSNSRSKGKERGSGGSSARTSGTDESGGRRSVPRCFFLFGSTFFRTSCLSQRYQGQRVKPVVCVCPAQTRVCSGKQFATVDASSRLVATSSSLCCAVACSNTLPKLPLPFCACKGSSTCAGTGGAPSPGGPPAFFLSAGGPADASCGAAAFSISSPSRASAAAPCASACGHFYAAATSAMSAQRSAYSSSHGDGDASVLASPRRTQQLLQQLHMRKMHRPIGGVRALGVPPAACPSSQAVLKSGLVIATAESRRPAVATAPSASTKASTSSASNAIYGTFAPEVPSFSQEQQGSGGGGGDKERRKQQQQQLQAPDIQEHEVDMYQHQQPQSLQRQRQQHMRRRQYEREQMGQLPPLQPVREDKERKGHGQQQAHHRERQHLQQHMPEQAQRRRQEQQQQPQEEHRMRVQQQRRPVVQQYPRHPLALQRPQQQQRQGERESLAIKDTLRRIEDKSRDRGAAETGREKHVRRASGHQSECMQLLRWLQEYEIELDASLQSIDADAAVLRLLLPSAAAAMLPQRVLLRREDYHADSPFNVSAGGPAAAAAAAAKATETIIATEESAADIATVLLEEDVEGCSPFTYMAHPLKLVTSLTTSLGSTPPPHAVDRYPALLHAAGTRSMQQRKSSDTTHIKRWELLRPGDILSLRVLDAVQHPMDIPVTSTGNAATTNVAIALPSKRFGSSSSAVAPATAASSSSSLSPPSPAAAARHPTSPRIAAAAAERLKSERCQQPEEDENASKIAVRFGCGDAPDFHAEWQLWHQTHSEARRRLGKCGRSCMADNAAVEAFRNGLRRLYEQDLSEVLPLLSPQHFIYQQQHNEQQQQQQQQLPQQQYLPAHLTTPHVHAHPSLLGRGGATTRRHTSAAVQDQHQEQPRRRQHHEDINEHVDNIPKYYPPSPQPHRCRILGLLHRYLLIEVLLEPPKKACAAIEKRERSIKQSHTDSERPVMRGEQQQQGHQLQQCDDDQRQQQQPHRCSALHQQQEQQKEQSSVHIELSSLDSNNGGNSRKSLVALLPADELDDVLAWVQRRRQPYVHRNTFKYGLLLTGKKAWEGFRAAQDEKTNRCDADEKEAPLDSLDFYFSCTQLLPPDLAFPAAAEAAAMLPEAIAAPSCTAAAALSTAVANAVLATASHILHAQSCVVTPPPPADGSGGCLTPTAATDSGALLPMVGVDRGTTPISSTSGCNRGSSRRHGGRSSELTLDSSDNCERSSSGSSRGTGKAEGTSWQNMPGGVLQGEMKKNEKATPPLLPLPAAGHEWFVQMSVHPPVPTEAAYMLFYEQPPNHLQTELLRFHKQLQQQQQQHLEHQLALYRPYGSGTSSVRTLERWRKQRRQRLRQQQQQQQPWWEEKGEDAREAELTNVLGRYQYAMLQAARLKAKQEVVSRNAYKVVLEDRYGRPFSFLPRWVRNPQKRKLLTLRRVRQFVTDVKDACTVLRSLDLREPLRELLRQHREERECASDSIGLGPPPLRKDGTTGGGQIATPLSVTVARGGQTEQESDEDDGLREEIKEAEDLDPAVRALLLQVLDMRVNVESPLAWVTAIHAEKYLQQLRPTGAAPTTVVEASSSSSSSRGTRFDCVGETVTTPPGEEAASFQAADAVKTECEEVGSAAAAAATAEEIWGPFLRPRKKMSIYPLWNMFLLHARVNLEMAPPPEELPQPEALNVQQQQQRRPQQRQYGGGLATSHKGEQLSVSGKRIVDPMEALLEQLPEGASNTLQDCSPTAVSTQALRGMQREIIQAIRGQQQQQRREQMLDNLVNLRDLHSPEEIPELEILAGGKAANQLCEVFLPLVQSDDVR